ncbi:monovalent cation/H+ antiporter subunit D [Mesorhizobium sp. 8]|uniref:monovalent cation/H+ antiporter subunit D n=1 Tax=Mesorhizobium sp. 8 TaxID=2584466 RepID=UPI001124BC10|nr:monovalent cation/H+ antiporter subunit D [Mesorhizobium sp. 8]QDC00441.1 monovalent cation/H+ antiporter subunit D [Mesorhizobium sp. 8]
MVEPAHLVVAPILIPLVTGALMLFFEDRERRLKTALSLVSILALISIATALLNTVHGGGHAASLVYLVGNWPAPIAISLVADRLAAVMLLLTALLALPAMIFATQRWEKVGPHFHSLFQFLLVGLNGAFLTGDLFNLFVFFEVMLAASYGLALHGGGALRVRGGLNYIVVNLVASLIFLIGIAMVFSAAGSLNMAEIALRAESMQGFALPALHVGLAMLGLAFLIKAGMWPLGLWLVPAYSAAAGPVAAVFAILSKVGVYALLRLALLVPNEGIAFGSLVIFIGGVATLVFASIGILASQSLKRAAGYFVLMSSGTLLAAFGMSQSAVTAGALFYMLSSTLAVGAFFLVVELIEREQDAASSVLAVTMEAYGEGEEDMEEEEAEVGRTMPGAVAILGIGFCLLAMVLIGLPPLPGFLAKFAILTALLGPEASVPAASNFMRGTLAVLLIASGVVSLVALSRAGIRVFWAPVEPFLPRITVTETAPILYLLGLLIALVLAAGPAMNLFLATADDLHHQVRYLDAVLGAERVPPFAEAHP